MKSWNLIFRRTHLYLGMLLIPWMAVYALSTLALNHREIAQQFRPADPQWEPLWEKDYQFDVPAGNEQLRETAGRILADNGLSGAFGVNRQGPRLNINLINFRQPIRLIYHTNEDRLVAERKKFSWTELLVRMHFRTGYGQPGFLNKIWPFMVDVYCLTLLVWVGTGIYLWWKLPVVRTSGWLTLGAGAAAFLILLLSV